MNEIISKYWDGSSASYSDIVREELDTAMREVWLKLVEDNRPQGEQLHVLDAGCGPGFFSILMGQNGHRIDAFDFSKDMLKKAKENAERYGVAHAVTFSEMDAHALEYDSGSFDLILSRNMTWTLQNPAKVYSEWLRVLKPGGKLLNFDANWNHRYYDAGLRLLMEQDFRRLQELGYQVDLQDGHGSEEAERVWSIGLPLNHENRPLWDVKTLFSLGCTDVRVVTKLPDGIMNEYYTNYYRHIPVFMVCATK